ncbi:universal stress protein [Inquilinus sp. OTU3971]|uniref:universal stress protein n=1 Tax=Inquilinus sp. OTU3971 TaxID=3043855 RepID=UPI00313BB155
MKRYLILCATDGSDAARKAIEFAAELAREKLAELLVVHVQQAHGSELMSQGLEELERVEDIRVTEADVLHGAAARIAEEGARYARECGAPHVESLVVEGDPARRTVETAKERGAGLIVIGSRGRGDLQGLLLGSVSHKVAHLAPCTCVIVR